jgi:AcrR family transcriptional regulator
VPSPPTSLDRDHALTAASDDGQAQARHRAAPLPPIERRATIVSATIPLLIEHGAKLTTRQIADAAGIAEGTIFRVFPDKDSLIDAALETAIDPEPTDRALGTIDRTLPLEARLEAAAEIIQRRVASIWQLMAAVGRTKPTHQAGAGKVSRPPDSAALAELFEPDHDRLRRDPATCAKLFRGVIFAGSHPALAEEPLAPAEIVSIFLDGVRGAGDQGSEAGRC